MNPGPIYAILFFCILPLISITLAFIAGIRYARHGLGGILPRKEELDGIRVLRSGE
jgi:hypothetical protein